MTQEATKPKAKRKPRATPEEKAQASQAAHDLIRAIEWIDVAQKDDMLRPVYEQHCVVAQGWIMAYDGVLLAGHTIEQEGYFAPNTARLLAALVKSGDGLSLHHDGERNTLTVKSKKFRADVPCVPPIDVNIPMPEPAMWEVNEQLLIALKIALPITKQAPEVLPSSLLFTSYGTVMATDRRLFIEVFHGCAMYECVIPRHFARIASNKEGLTHAGFSDGALTLWFGPTKFLRCQLYERSGWPPKPDMVFDESKGEGSAVAIPADFAKAVEAVAPHSPDGSVYLDGKRVMSATVEAAASAIHDCDGIPAGVSFGGADLVRGLKLASKLEYVDDRGLFIFGEGWRGKITARAAMGEHIGSDQPAAAHTAFDAPPGFVLPGVIDPAGWREPAPIQGPAERDYAGELMPVGQGTRDNQDHANEAAPVFAPPTPEQLAALQYPID